MINKFRNNRIFIKFPITKQFTKFLIIGCYSLIIDFTVYIFLTRTFHFWSKHYLLANFISFLSANYWSFYSNRRWTFKAQNVKIIKQYLKFLSVTFTGLILTELLLYIFVKYFGLFDIFAKIIIAAIIAIWNFSAHKLWTFNYV